MGTDRKLRQYDPNIDYSIVSGWWGEKAVHPSMLTDFGVFGLENGEDVACAWLYVNNRSNVARVENIIINPEYHGDNEPVAHIFNFFRMECEKIGKRMEIDMPFSGSALVKINDKPSDFLDRCHAAMAELPQAEHETTHTFTPGLYTRQIFIHAGTLCMSKIHKTEHPFVISKGDISVWSRESGAVRLKAPFSGITKPGTQRILYAHEDTIWTTFHVADEISVEAIEDRIIEKHENPYLKGGAKCLTGT